MGPVSAEVEIDVPRERAFETIGDFSRRLSFTDHFVSGFHLTRIDSAGIGAGARFRVEAPLNSIWMDTTIVEIGGAPPDRRARPRRAQQPHAHHHRLGADRGSRLADHGPRLPLDRALPPPGQGPGGARRHLDLARARLARGAAPAARPARVRGARRGPDRRRRGQPLRDRHPLIDSRRRCPLPQTRPAADRRARARRGRPRRLGLRLLERLQGRGRGRAGDARKAPLQRRLLPLPEPERQRGLRLPGRPAARPPGSTYFGVFFQVQNEDKSPQTLPKSLKITDAQHQVYDAIPSESLYAFPLGGEVEPEEQVPVLDSTPSRGRSRAPSSSSSFPRWPPTTGR